jgi:hypothetical protein
MCSRIVRSFRSRPESVREVRRLVASALQTWSGQDPDSFGAGSWAIPLIASELSANAVEASSEDFRVALTVHRDCVEIAVEDRDRRPARVVGAGPDDCSGRGLALVAALSSSWGQEPHDGCRKKVWSRVAVPLGFSPLNEGSR